MGPNDDNGRLPPDERPLRVLIISGSDRRQYNCPGVDSGLNRDATLHLKRGEGEKLRQEPE